LLSEAGNISWLRRFKWACLKIDPQIQCLIMIHHYFPIKYSSATWGGNPLFSDKARQLQHFPGFFRLASHLPRFLGCGLCSMSWQRELTMGPEWRELLRSEGSPLARTIKLLPPHYPQVRTVLWCISFRSSCCWLFVCREDTIWYTKSFSSFFIGSERSLRCQREIDEEWIPTFHPMEMQVCWCWQPCR
jgi:hypothetical protein